MPGAGEPHVEQPPRLPFLLRGLCVPRRDLALVHAHHEHDIKLLAFGAVESHEIQMVGRAALVAEAGDRHGFKFATLANRCGKLL